MIFFGDVFMKKIIVIPVIVVVLIGIIFLYYSQQTGYIKIEAPGFETDLNLSSRWDSKEISVSGSEPVGIRAGTYKPERIVVRLTKTSEQWWSILCRREPWGKLATILARLWKFALMYNAGIGQYQSALHWLAGPANTTVRKC